MFHIYYLNTSGIIHIITYTIVLCKAQPRRALLGYPFHNTAAHTEATHTREGI